MDKTLKLLLSVALLVMVLAVIFKSSIASITVEMDELLPAEESINEFLVVETE